VEDTQRSISDEVALAKQALPALQDRLRQTEKELTNCRALVKDLTAVELKQRSEIDGHAMQVSQLTNKVMLLETSKAQLYTQLGALKVSTLLPLLQITSYLLSIALSLSLTHSPTHSLTHFLLTYLLTGLLKVTAKKGMEESGARLVTKNKAECRLETLKGEKDQVHHAPCTMHQPPWP
jgi:hypothetical protein